MQNLTIQLLKNNPGPQTEFTLAAFLHSNLGAYGDPEPAIRKAIKYALSDAPGKGGFVLTGYDNGELVAVLVVNRTGMADYIPENHLVYVAVDEKRRSQGVGRQMIQQALAECRGDVSMHVDPDNPARRLYEQLGFEAKYIEMRYLKGYKPNCPEGR